VSGFGERDVVNLRGDRAQAVADPREFVDRSA